MDQTAWRPPDHHSIHVHNPDDLITRRQKFPFFGDARYIIDYV